MSELPRLPRASGSDATWAVTATLLATAVATPVMGRIGEMYGKRLMLLTGLGGRRLGRAGDGADGSHVVEAPGEGTYVLVASAGGRRPQATTVVGAHPVSHDPLLDGAGELAGVVRAAEGGAPVAGAVVVVRDVRGEVPARVRADELGEFALTALVPGTVTLAVS
ncbi:carboxypeptidase regulatory-like domain-containing protein [Streptomyces sp. CG1]|uniref:carboxypeptidase regulatory-like domain-containing protein n=1 Tax=Streptomyces sp. CG1 TaxID=1287523 RepID=UPI0034E2D6C9